MGVEFLYRNNVEDEDSIDFDLFAIAHKYDVKPLQALCETKLSTQLDANKVLDAWSSANLFQSSLLIEACKRFIKKDWIKIRETTKYSQLKREDKEGLVKIMANVIDPRNDTILGDLLDILK